MDTFQPLTIQQLHDALGELIQQGHGGKALEIPRDPGHATLGGTPAVKIKGVFNGFDWDQGRFFLVPETRLGVPDAELRKRMREAENLLGHLHMAARAGQGGDEAQRLETLREHLRKLGEKLAGRAGDQTLG